MRIRHTGWFGGALVGAALLLGGCGTPPPDGSTTTTTLDDTACRTERDTIETALEAWAVSEIPYTYPATLQVLFEGGYIEHPPSAAWTYSTDGASFTLTGDC